MQDKKELKKAKKIMMDILLELDRICKKENIKYWITDGTLLGAVRHKGFIPWDDDIDICMLSEDYENFLKIAKENLNTSIFLDNKETDKYAFFDFLKLRDRNSKYIEKVHTHTELFHQGISIDIFVMDSFDRKIKPLYKILYMIKNFKISKGKNRFYFLKLILIKFKIKKLVSKFLLCFLIQENVERKDFLIGYRYLWKQVYESRDIFPLKKIEFEGHKFPCPNNPDAILKELYGNKYMELPPEDQRIWHTSYINTNEKCHFEKLLEESKKEIYEK